MAKRKYEMTENKIKAFEKEGRGQGEGKDYKPWLTMHDVPSNGFSTRTNGWKTNRIHHFLSTLERDYFYILEWNPNIIDIREQYPLIREDTIAIAEQKGIKHPTDPQSQIPIVMTTDFLISIKTSEGQKHIARTIKPSKELENARVIDKFEIERTYWESRDIDWGIVTEKDIPQTISRNVEWLHRAYYEINDITSSTLTEFSHQLQHLILNNKELSVVELTAQFDRMYQLENGTGLDLLKHLIARKKLEIDITQRLHTHLWVKDIFNIV